MRDDKLKDKIFLTNFKELSKFKFFYVVSNVTFHPKEL